MWVEINLVRRSAIEKDRGSAVEMAIKEHMTVFVEEKRQCEILGKTSVFEYAQI